MSNQENHNEEITIMDVYDRAVKLRQAIGYVADSAVKDPQLSALLSTIEESAGLLESMLEYLFAGRRGRSAAAHEDVPFD